ncbi:hypothetical protein HX880_34480 [Pseudomonas sp. F1002]|nr:hypothetical protein [Pseudomonas sp. F1002]
MLSEDGNRISYDPHGPEVVLASAFDGATRLFLDAAERAVASERREKELQQRLTEADQQIDLLSPRHTEQPEGKRERFEKWVMATNHPVYGFLDGRSLARGDDRTGYADEYVQGLWVAYLAFGVEQPEPVAVASRDESIAWLKRIDGIGQNRAELIYSMGFRRHTEVPQS